MHMKQKIVIRVPLKTERKKSKAMKIAVSVRGVSAVGVEMDEDELVVIGERIDSVYLAKCLRKKFQFADIISIEEIMTPFQYQESHSPYAQAIPFSPQPSPYSSYPISSPQPSPYSSYPISTYHSYANYHHPPVGDSSPSNCSVM